MADGVVKACVVFLGREDVYTFEPKMVRVRNEALMELAKKVQGGDMGSWSITVVIGRLTDVRTGLAPTTAR